MSAKDAHSEWKSVCDSLASGKADSEAILKIVGPHVLKMDADRLREALGPDLWLSGKLTIQDILLPASSGHWPVRELDEYRWVWSETISGIVRRWSSRTDIWFPLYGAAVLLHCETVEGLQAIPLSPLCVAIACEAAHVLLDREVTAGLIEFLVGEMHTRLGTHSGNDPKEWLTPLATGIAMLLRVWGAQLVLQGSGNESELSAPWLWHPSLTSNASRPVWESVLKRDEELSQLVMAWAVERTVDKDIASPSPNR